MPTLSLDQILEQCPAQICHAGASAPTATIDSIVLDSRKATTTSIFVALCGQNLDGRKFIPTCKAPIILVDRWDAEWSQKAEDWQKTILKVDNARASMAELAAEICDQPATKMTMVGITGTNGKTTTTWMLSHILKACRPGDTIGTIGTIGHRINGKPLPQQDGFTTPEAPGLQRVLREFVHRQCSVCIMEVSSIGLMMHRVGAIQFDVTAFTNFTQDHLDIHGSMDAYLTEKQKLFDTHVGANSTSILVVDQPEIASTPVQAGDAIRVSTTTHPNCDLWVDETVYSLEGTHFTLHTDNGTHRFTVPLIGQHNIENAVVASTIAHRLGISFDSISSALASLPQAPGRLERISSPDGWHAFVDYAHTPDALLQSLSSLRPLCTGRLWVLFGCGGDRDKRKRPQMGSIAAYNADCVVVTSDNPRTENPSTIVDDILIGIPQERLKSTHRIVDRREAIQWTTQQLQAEDVLLVAGKGHETYQVIGKVKHHFDDREELLRTI